MIIEDKFSRKLRDLRISVTDRCNFRCSYCMPSEVFNSKYKFFNKSEILSFEEIIRVAKILAFLGIKKIRITGGEPLLRTNVHILIKELKNIEGISDVSMTTNGVLLTEGKALLLKESGLNRLTVSLDTLNDVKFKKISGSVYSTKDVLKGIANADKAGFKNIKINMVVKRNENDADIIPMLEYFSNSGCILRFIEYMDVGNVNSWNENEVFSLNDILKIILKKYDITPLLKNYKSEVAKRWSYNGGEFGIISSISNPFCSDCARIRLTADGNLYTCLFSNNSHNLKTLIRSEKSDKELEIFIKNLWSLRDDRYSLDRFKSDRYKVIKKVEMSYIGG